MDGLFTPSTMRRYIQYMENPNIPADQLRALFALADQKATDEESRKRLREALRDNHPELAEELLCGVVSDEQAVAENQPPVSNKAPQEELTVVSET